MTLLDTIKNTFVPIHREGYPFIAAFGAATLFLGYFSSILFWIGLILTGCWAGAGGSIGIGERFGLIRFGSRVDVFLPANAVARVAVGQTAVGGETVLAEFGGIAVTPLVRVS